MANTEDRQAFSPAGKAETTLGSAGLTACATLIIGYGNRLRSDDGAGVHAAELLRERSVDSGVQILAVPQLTPELVEPIARTQRVIFVDAAAEGRPGEIRQRALAASPAGTAFTHRMTPEALLAGAAALYGASPAGVLYSICGESFAYGERLTPAVERALMELVEKLSI
ncbi:MAG: hydrogenase maturation protease [Bryobacteraceae bacterium]